MREDEGWREARSAKRMTTHALHCPEGGLTTSHQTDGLVSPMTLSQLVLLCPLIRGGEEGWDIKHKQAAACQQQGQAGLSGSLRPKQLNSADRSRPGATQTLPRPFWLGQAGAPAGGRSNVTKALAACSTHIHVQPKSSAATW